MGFVNQITWNKKRDEGVWISGGCNLKIVEEIAEAPDALVVYPTYEVFHINPCGSSTVAVGCGSLEEAQRVAAGYWAEQA